MQCANTDVVPFPFLQQGELSQLWQCLKNYECIGHVELARATLRQLFDLDFEETVQYVSHKLENGIQDRSILLRDRRQIYFLWMYFQEYTLQNNPITDLIHLTYSRLIYDLLLINYIEEIELTEKISKALYSMRQYYYQIMYLRKEYDTITFQIDEISKEYIEILQNPNVKSQKVIVDLLGKLMIHDLDTFNNISSFSTICENQENIISSIMKFIESSINQQNEKISLIEGLSFFSIFPPLSSLSEDIKVRINNIFFEIHTKIEKQASKEFQIEIIHALLATKNKEILHLFEKSENYFVEPPEDVTKNPLHPLHFWNQYFKFIDINNTHIMEYTINKSIDLIQHSQNIEKIQNLLQHFQPLQPMLLLIFWEFVSSDFSLLIKLTNILYNPPEKYELINGTVKYHEIEIDQRIIDACCLLKHQVEASLWCANKIYKSENKKEENSYIENLKENEDDEKNLHIIASRILPDLQNQSLLYVLQKSLKLKDIDMEEFIHLLKSQEKDSLATREYKIKNFLEISSFHIFSLMDQLCIKWINQELKIEKLSIFLDKIKEAYINLNETSYQIHVLDALFSFLFLPNLSAASKKTKKINNNNDYQILLQILLMIESNIQSIITNHKENSILNDLDYLHVKEFEKLISESIWRLTIIRDCYSSNEFCNLSYSILQIWASEPNSFLMSCLRSQNFKVCEKVIEYYSLENETITVSVVNDSKKLSFIRENINKIENQFQNELFQLKEHSSSYLLSLFDILSTLDINKVKINELLTQIETETKSNDFNEKYNQINNSLSKFYNLFLKIHTIFPSFNINKLILSSSLIFYEENNDFFQKQLWPSENKCNQQIILWNLFNLICSNENIYEMNLTNEQFHYFHENLQNLQNSNVQKKENQYFFDYLFLIKQMIDILYDKSGDNNEIYSLKFLQNKPDELIGSFVFESDFEKAEKLANLFHRDLIMGVINSIKPIHNNKDEDLSSPHHDHHVVLTQNIVDYFCSRSPYIALFSCLYKYPISSPFPSWFLEQSQMILQSKFNFDIKNSIFSRWIYSHLLKYYYFIESNFDIEKQNENLIPLPLLTDKEIETLPFIPFPSNITLNENQIETLKDIQNYSCEISLEKQENFYLQIIEKYKEKKQFKKAIEIVDMFIEDGGNDQLLLELINSNPSESYKYIPRMKDIKTACSITLNHIKYWPISMAIEILEMFLENNKEQSKQIQNILQELQIYEQLLQLDQSESENWENIAQSCRKNTSLIIDKLSKEKNFELARKISLLFSSDISIHNKIESNFIIVQMKNMLIREFNTNISKIFKKRNHEKSNSSFIIAEYVIDEISLQIPKLDASDKSKSSKQIIEEFQNSVEYFIEIQLFMVYYLLNNCFDDIYLEKFTLNDLLKKQLGLKILQNISLEYIERFLHLSEFPKLIIEGLILSEQTAEISLILQKLPELQDDELNSFIHFYAIKSMDIDLIQHSNHDSNLSSSGGGGFKPVSSHSTLRQIRRDFISIRHSEDTCRRLKRLIVIDDYAVQLRERLIPFNGNLEHDQYARERFNFNNTPNIRLFKSLICLSTNYSLAAEKSLELANQLSNSISGSPDPLFLTDQVQQVILTAKFLMLEANLSSEICDRLLDYLTVIQSLIIKKVSNSFNLLDFNDIQKIEQLRDRLIKEDHILLAMDVCIKCHLDASSVWYSWGISLLRMGNYTEAKEKFSNCLKVKFSILLFFFFFYLFFFVYCRKILIILVNLLVFLMLCVVLEIILLLLILLNINLV